MAKRIKSIDELKQYQGEYSESKFWAKLQKFAQKIGGNVVYQVLLLYYLMVSPDVSIKDKSIIIGALGYLILPIDLIPDVVPVLGFTDDAAAIAMALNAVKGAITPEIEAKAKQKLNELF